MRNLLEWPITGAEKLEALDWAIRVSREEGAVGSVTEAALVELRESLSHDSARTAWVLMGNDFPEGVFTDRNRADAAVHARRDAVDPTERTVYWRLRDFVINEDTQRPV